MEEMPPLVNSHGRLYVVDCRPNKRVIVRKKSIYSAFMDTAMALGGTVFINGVRKASNADVTRLFRRKGKK